MMVQSSHAARDDMAPEAHTHATSAALCVAMVVCAVVAAPRSCAGGLEAYVLAGLVGVVARTTVDKQRHVERTREDCTGLVRQAVAGSWEDRIAAHAGRA